jgi:hypothetical protein
MKFSNPLIAISRIGLLVVVCLSNQLSAQCFTDDSSPSSQLLFNSCPSNCNDENPNYVLDAD